MPGHRTVAKHSYLTGKDKGVARAKAHINYIQFRAGKDQEKEERSFFNGLRDDIYNKELKDAISDQDPRGTVMHKLILSPGVPGADVKEYAREVMADLSSKKGLDLEWYAVEHNNTDNAHCHIVIMGKDENGRNVRIYKKDYEVIKEAGDRYLERHRLLDREERDKEREEKDKEKSERSTVSRFFDALKAAAKEFARNMGKDEKDKERDETEYQRRKREKEEERDRERSLLGDDLDYDSKLLREQQSEERQEAEKEKAWKEYCKPIEIQYRLPDGEDLSFAFDRSNSIEILKDLEKNVQDKGIKEADHERLKSWISEKEREQARVQAKAEKLEEIDISLDSEQEIKWTKDSTLEDLKKLEDLNSRHEVFLDAVEQKALENWIRDQELKEPIRVELEKSDVSIVYERSDSVDALTVLLMNAESGKLAGLEEKDIEKLKTWILEKDASKELDPEHKIAIVGRDEDRHEYSRETELSELRSLEATYLNDAAVLSDKDYKELTVWIADKEREDAQLNRLQTKDAQDREQETPIRVDEKGDDGIRYGERFYSKDTPLKELQQFREELIHESKEGRYENRLEKEKFSQLCSWIGSKDYQERQEAKSREAKEREDREAAKEAGPMARAARYKELQNERNLEKEPEAGKERELDEDAITYLDGRTFDKHDTLEKLQAFREELKGSRYERWLDEEEFSKLCSWIGVKETYGKAAFSQQKPGEHRERIPGQKERAGEHIPRRKLSALEKRMERAMRQEKAERLKNYYAEKALQRERLEKSKEEARTDIKWERASAGKPVMQFVNLLRKGARELEKQRKHEKEKELAKANPDTKETKDKTEKNDKKKAVLPYPEPKSHLEELANKRAQDLEEKNRTKKDIEKEQQLRGEHTDQKSQDKPKDKTQDKTNQKNKDEKSESKTKSRQEKDKEEEDRGGR
jgi:hypothetical protein